MKWKIEEFYMRDSTEKKKNMGGWDIKWISGDESGESVTEKSWQTAVNTWDGSVFTVRFIKRRSYLKGATICDVMQEIWQHVLMEALTDRLYSTGNMKPLFCGCEGFVEMLLSDDRLSIWSSGPGLKTRPWCSALYYQQWSKTTAMINNGQ